MLYDLTTGQIRVDGLKRQLKRPAHLPTQCDQRGAKPCPRGHWSDPKGFDDATYALYTQIKQCEQTGFWPQDLLFLEFAKTVRLAEETVNRSKDQADRSLQLEIAKAMANPKRPQQ